MFGNTNWNGDETDNLAEIEKTITEANKQLKHMISYMQFFFLKQPNNTIIKKPNKELKRMISYMQNFV